jgi:site-specific DNA-methyltransferase (adenine-specific)
MLESENVDVHKKDIRKKDKIDPAIDLTGAVVYHGNSLDVLSTLPSNSIDSIVTDPPYELGFMGKSWDSSGIAYSVDLWSECLRVLKPGGHILAFGGSRTWHRLAVAIEDSGFEVRDTIAWIYSNGFPKSRNLKDEWQGWGTALKPAIEPIVMARKPLVGTVVKNVELYGVGAINIDASRIQSEDAPEGRSRHGGGVVGAGTSYELPDSESYMPAGRWPANITFDEGTAGLLEYQSEGSSRFFYVSKASKSDRNEGLGTLVNTHPTVKPTDLMRYLINLVTPVGGVVLDPFTGSGSTGKAALLDGFQFIGIELTAEYLPIIKERLQHALKEVNSE